MAQIRAPSESRLRQGSFLLMPGTNAVSSSQVSPLTLPFPPETSGVVTALIVACARPPARFDKESAGGVWLGQFLVAAGLEDARQAHPGKGWRGDAIGLDRVSFN